MPCVSVGGVTGALTRAIESLRICSSREIESVRACSARAMESVRAACAIESARVFMLIESVRMRSAATMESFRARSARVMESRRACSAIESARARLDGRTTSPPDLRIGMRVVDRAVRVVSRRVVST